MLNFKKLCCGLSVPMNAHEVGGDQCFFFSFREPDISGKKTGRNRKPEAPGFFVTTKMKIYTEEQDDKLSVRNLIFTELIHDVVTSM